MSAATTKINPVFLAAAGALVMMAHQVGAKSVRDSLFLTSFGIAQLPLMVIVGAVFSLALVFPASWATTKFTPGKLVPWMFLTSGIFYGVLWMVGEIHPKASAVAVFLAVVGFGSLLTSGFWALISERLDPYSVKKAVGRIGAGGSVGVALGGLLAERVGAMFDATVMLLVLGGLHAICGLFALAVRSSAAPASPDSESDPPQPPRSILKLAREAPYLRILAVLVLLGTVSAGLIDYVFKAESAARLADEESLLRFFAMFYAVTGVLTFVIQTLISSAALERFGLAKTVGTMPFSVVAGGLGALLFPGLAATAIARGSESIFRGSLFRSGYELFYAPMPAAEKRAAKPILDVGFDRLGDAAAGGAVKLILFVAPVMAVNIILSLAVLFGLAGLWIALQLQEAYRDVLAKNLIGRRATLRAGEREKSSLFASAVLTQTSLMASGDDSVAPVDESIRVTPAATNELAPTIEALRSAEPARIFGVLAAWNEPPLQLVGYVIPLLGSTTIYPEALRVLREGAEKYTGQLIDALVSPDTPEPIRRRLPRVLSHCRTQRSLDGLTCGLDDESFDVRQSCGRAMASIYRARPSLRVDKERVLEVVAREAALGRTVWEAFRDSRGQHLEGAGELAQTLLENAGSQVLDHIFKILTLVIPWEPLQVAFYGLHTNDTHLRGTALEYLEGVLPAPVRTELWPYLEDDQVRERPRMSSDAALKELLLTRTRMGSRLEEANRQFSGESLQGE